MRETDVFQSKQCDKYDHPRSLCFRQENRQGPLSDPHVSASVGPRTSFSELAGSPDNKTNSKSAKGSSS